MSNNEFRNFQIHLVWVVRQTIENFVEFQSFGYYQFRLSFRDSSNATLHFRKIGKIVNWYQIITYVLIVNSFV